MNKKPFVIRHFNFFVVLMFAGAVLDVWTTIWSMIYHDRWTELNPLVTPNNFFIISVLRMSTPFLFFLLERVTYLWEEDDWVRRWGVGVMFFWSFFFIWIPPLTTLGLIPPAVGSLFCIPCQF